MDGISSINNQNFIDDETLKRINEHALLYETAYDKKEFLRNVSVYEQKIILMNSTKPYDVLNYLDQLDLKGTRLLLEKLNFDEIKHIISLFTSEDKKKFYATFSDLSLVNQFIVQDQNSSEHVENLSFERKVELMDSSDKKTQAATAVIYESMPVAERVSAAEKVIDVDACYTLESTTVYSDTQEQVAVNETIEQEGQLQPVTEEVQIPQNIEDEQAIEDGIKEQQPILELSETQENLEISDSQPNLSSEQNNTLLEQFQEEKSICEQLQILNIMMQKEQKEFNEIMNIEQPVTKSL